jgi:hypothetical protein
MPRPPDYTLEQVVEQQLECHCCQARCAPLTKYPIRDLGRDVGVKLLCELCANSMIGMYADYPKQHDADALAIMKQSSFLANKILHRLACLEERIAKLERSDG